MILNKLAVEYERLVEQGKLDRPGWSPAKVAYALELGERGELTAVLSLRDVQEIEGKNGKVKTVVLPRIMTVPEPAKRTVGVESNFLCDNSTYFLGIDSKGKPERTAKCFQAAKELHHQLLDGLDTPIARSICAFFDTWVPAEAESNSVLKPYLEEILKGYNLVFCVDEVFAQQDEEIRTAWQNHYDSGSDDIVMPCLDTGEVAPVAILHPSIKGIRDAAPTGASLVSFNAPSYESYGRSGAQGLNAPVSKYTAFAYGAALNYLIADRERTQRVGDTTIVCWADSGSEVYQDLLCCSLSDSEAQSTQLQASEVQAVVRALANGQPADLNGIPLGPEEPFYILGLSPNVARLSVRFFLQGSFGDFARNIDAHYRRLEIADTPERSGLRSVWGLLQETVNQNASDKSPKPHLAGDLLRAILMNTRYPETMLQGVEIRIRADREINWRRAAILKSILLKNYPNNKNYQEAAAVKLNEQCSYAPYVLGRIFSLYEYIQTSANPGINATIRDRYFNAAAATPASVFGTLGRLCQSHLKKLPAGQKIYLEKQLSALYNLLEEEIPARMNLQDQATFQIGYYHQNKQNYTKKTEVDE